MNIKTIFITTLVVCTFFFIACGAETILLRPSLDTPSHHIDNGYKLMAYGKLDAAIQEFNRARELNATSAPAYVGLGIAYGMKSNLEKGRALMEQAQKLARDDEERKEVEMGFERLDYIEKESQN